MIIRVLTYTIRYSNISIHMINTEIVTHSGLINRSTIQVPQTGQATFDNIMSVIIQNGDANLGEDGVIKNSNIPTESYSPLSNDGILNLTPESSPELIEAITEFTHSVYGLSPEDLENAIQTETHIWSQVAQSRGLDLKSYQQAKMRMASLQIFKDVIIPQSFSNWNETDTNTIDLNVFGAPVAVIERMIVLHGADAPVFDFNLDGLAEIAKSTSTKLKTEEINDSVPGEIKRMRKAKELSKRSNTIESIEKAKNNITQAVVTESMVNFTGSVAKSSLGEQNAKIREFNLKFDKELRIIKSETGLNLKYLPAEFDFSHIEGNNRRSDAQEFLKILFTATNSDKNKAILSHYQNTDMYWLTIGDQNGNTHTMRFDQLTQLLGTSMDSETMADPKQVRDRLNQVIKIFGDAKLSFVQDENINVFPTETDYKGVTLKDEMGSKTFFQTWKHKGAKTMSLERRPTGDRYVLTEANGTKTGIYAADFRTVLNLRNIRMPYPLNDQDPDKEELMNFMQILAVNGQKTEITGLTVKKIASSHETNYASLNGRAKDAKQFFQAWTGKYDNGHPITAIGIRWFRNSGLNITILPKGEASGMMIDGDLFATTLGMKTIKNLNSETIGIYVGSKLLCTDSSPAEVEEALRTLEVNGILINPNTKILTINDTNRDLKLKLQLPGRV
jgi:hypothetical protein